MDEAELGAWQAALVAALLGADDTTVVRAHLRRLVPWAESRIAALDDRAILVAIDLVRRWSPTHATRERG